MFLAPQGRELFLLHTCFWAYQSLFKSVNKTFTLFLCSKVALIRFVTLKLNQ